MIGINSNINSLVAQQNLNGTQNALSSAITRLSSGKRVNSGADDAAGLAIATRMTAQINGLNQGVSNANDGVSLVQTANSGLSQIADNLQRIRQLAVQASSGSLSASDQSALQQEVSQRISEINRVSSQTTFNGKSLLDGSAGSLSFQVGANVGQSISVDLSTANVSAGAIGTPGKGATLGTIDGLSLDSSGAYTSTGATITSVTVKADGSGGFTYEDNTGAAFTGTNLFTAATAGGFTLKGAAFSGGTAPTTGAQVTELASLNTASNVPSVNAIDVSATGGAAAAIYSVDNALATINTLQASLGATQNRFSSVASAQSAQATNLSSAQSQIMDANFAQETANLSKAQVLQQAGISVLAQANSMPQQVLKLLG
ncbi:MULTISPECIES: flagellin [Caballeronia]|uniref:Flagellin n=1 Tax=Caballeronia cordobensis TaxID=1353886 RepID=A0A158F0F6_CABCO|nr:MULTISPECIES: flagellin [Caballeronia]AET87941.1 flagellin [Burkholderia sp. YI23]AQG97496.1 flagellin [Burkholderia sp. KK1]BAO85166.1 flagellin [Burkholderia sp. RPE67]BBP94993.1 flagellin [Burkholderia sp. SFA1]MCE4543128.1 flagellin [Caballeronia sp. PC1]